MKKFTILLLVLASCSGRPRFEPFDSLPNYSPPVSMSKPRAELDAILAKDSWSLKDLLNLGELMNPDLQIARREVEFAGTQVWEAGLYPNPTLGYEYDDAPVSGSGRGKGTHTATLTFPLVYSGRLGTAADAARSTREVRLLAWEEMRLHLRSKIKRAFAEVLFVERSLKLARELRTVAKKFHNLTEVRFNAGDVAEMEVLKTKVSFSRLDLETTRLTKAVEAAYRTLYQFVGKVDLPRKKLIGKLESRYPNLRFEALRDRALAGNPRLLRAKKALEAAKRELDLARAERWPDLGITLGFGRDTAEDENVVEGGLEIPLPLFNRNQAKIAGADIRIRQAELRIASLQNELVAELARVHGSYEATLDSVRRYEMEILPAAKTANEQTIEGYQNKKFSYLDVLDSQRTLFETQAAHLIALRGLARDAAELERLVGGKIE